MALGRCKTEVPPHYQEQIRRREAAERKALIGSSPRVIAAERARDRAYDEWVRARRDADLTAVAAEVRAEEARLYEEAACFRQETEALRNEAARGNTQPTSPKGLKRLFRR